MALERGALAVVASSRVEVTPCRVLIVEDDPPLAENLQEIVELLGYQTVVVPSAEAALTEICERRVDFIVTDHRLPGMSGAAFLRSLRATGRTIPSVMATAWIADPEADEAAQGGLMEVLGKPIDIPHLLSLLRTTLGPTTPDIH